MKHRNKLAKVAVVSAILLIIGAYLNDPGLSPLICAIGLFGSTIAGIAYLIEWLSAE